MRYVSSIVSEGGIAHTKFRSQNIHRMFCGFISSNISDLLENSGTMINCLDLPLRSEISTYIFCSREMIVRFLEDKFELICEVALNANVTIIIGSQLRCLFKCMSSEMKKNKIKRNNLILNVFFKF